MSSTFVIGDVHGCYYTLIDLVDKLPKDADLIFVGDLIDRGKYPSKVVKFIRKNRYKSVLGNHEYTFIKFFNEYQSATNFDMLKEKWHSWLFLNGGKKTLESYNLWENFDPSKEILEKVQSDILWMQNLPIYIELDVKYKNKLPIVVSHSNITKVWKYKDNSDKQEYFLDRATRERDLSYDKDSKIFNIYGHTPNTNPRANLNSINIDSGCCFGSEDFNYLTAYCIEDDTFIYQKNIDGAYN